MTDMEKRTLEEQMKETEARLRYQRALYRVHDTDDPDLKEYFNNIIKDYVKAHPENGKKPEDPRQQTLPGFEKAFSDRANGR